MVQEFKFMDFALKSNTITHSWFLIPLIHSPDKNEPKSKTQHFSAGSGVQPGFRKRGVLASG
jgi:hypothetical protein